LVGMDCRNQFLDRGRDGSVTGDFSAAKSGVAPRNGCVGIDDLSVEHPSAYWSPHALAYWICATKGYAAAVDANEGSGIGDASGRGRTSAA